MNDAPKAYPPVVMPSLEQQIVLKGQKALITGASSGIGKQVAIELGHAGADIVGVMGRRIFVVGLIGRQMN